MSAQAPVGTTLALLERQLKVMTAVQARLHYTFKQELGLLAEIIADYTEPTYDYDPDTSNRSAKKKDYDYVEIIPVSDPNAATMSQRVVQYQAVIQMAQMAPDIYDLPQLHRRMLEVLGIKNAEKLVKLADDQKPQDPVTENMSIIRGEPVKAFFYQDQQAHIQVHMAMMQDPSIAQLIGQNPKAPMIQAALMAHISEHVAFDYRLKIENSMGIPLPAEDAELPPQVELSLSSMMAQAAQQVLQQSQAQASQQQAQQQAQDPLVQLQQQDMQIKQGGLQLEVQKAQQQFQLDQERLNIEKQRMILDSSAKADANNIRKDEIKSKMELEGFKAGSSTQEKQARLKYEQESAGVRMGADIAKTNLESQMKGTE